MTKSERQGIRLEGPGRAGLLGLLAGAATLGAACGARSTLEAPEAQEASTSVTTTPSGTGGSSTGGSSTGGGGAGGSGAGGSALNCVGLTVTAPVIELPGSDGYHQRQPMLSFSSDDHLRVSVVAEWIAVKAPGKPPSELRHTALKPWGLWPIESATVKSYLASFDGGASFAAAPGLDNHLGLLFVDPTTAPATLRFSPAFDPGSGGIPPADAIDSRVGRALFASLSGKLHLLGYEFPPESTPGNPGVTSLELTLYGGGKTADHLSLGCADAPQSADALPTDDGFLIASTSSDALTCKGGLQGPAFLSVDRLTSKDGVPSTSAFKTIASATGFTDVVLAARPGGAWLLATEHSAAGAGPVTTFVLDPTGMLLSSFPLSTVGELREGTAVGASLGDALSVVAVRPPSPGVPEALVARLYDVTGALISSVSLPLQGSVVGAPAALASPDGRSALVAWSERRSGGDRDRIRLVEIGCAGLGGRARRAARGG